jgi:hypothetical protein
MAGFLRNDRKTTAAYRCIHSTQFFGTAWHIRTHSVGAFPLPSADMGKSANYRFSTPSFSAAHQQNQLPVFDAGSFSKF